MDRSPAKQPPRAVTRRHRPLPAMCSLLIVFAAGCYAPMHSPGIAARTLPDEYRWPIRTSAAPLNYSQLVGQAQDIYLLGPGDTLQITAPDLMAVGHSEPFEVQVLDHGEIYLPRLGPVSVGGLSIAQAQQQVNQALANNLLANPSTVMTLKEKGTVNVLVLGAVKQQGVHALPRDANDVAHALAAAQGFSENAGEVIEIHRHGRNLPLHMSNAAAKSDLPLQYPANVTAASSNGNTHPVLQASASQPISSPQTSLQSAHHLPLTPTLSATQQHSQGMPVGVIMAPAESGQRGHQSPTMQLSSYRESASRYPSQSVMNSPQHDALAAVHGNEMSTDSRPLGGHSLATFHGRSQSLGDISSSPPIVRIPLRGENGMTNPCDVILNSGDVIVIPQKTDKVFYVVGPLSERNSVRFTVNDKDREIGGGLLLPENREIDVVTAVAMAGYIDPIESPTTVTVHRVLPDRSPLLIRVDLIAARSDPLETVMVQAGDIIYLNPDGWWYGRRTMDRVIDRALGTAVGRWLTN